MKKNSCLGCTLCCDYVIVRIKTPKTQEDFDFLFWYICHGIEVFIDLKSKWSLKIDVRCRELNKKNVCNSYNLRPKVCREYSRDSCEHECEQVYFKQVFKTRKDLLRYVRGKKKEN